MQKASGLPGMGGCHGGATQQWDITAGGRISSVFQGDGKVCLGISAEATLAMCAFDDPAYQWFWDGSRLKPKLLPELCLERVPEADGANMRAELRECRSGAELKLREQSWNFIVL